VRSRSGLRAAAALAAVLLLSACSAGAADGPIADLEVHDPDGLHGLVLPEPYDVPDVALTDTEGAAYDIADDAGKPLTVVFFGYTHCPDICQVVMADVASAMTRLDPADRDRVGMLFVTTDPARDDPATLRSYLDRFDPGFEGLTGDLPDIVRAGKALGVSIEKGAKLPTGGYDVAHGTQLVGVLPDGTAPLIWTQGTAPADLAEDITAVLDDGVPDLKEKS
jgi:protein SCO1